MIRSFPPMQNRVERNPAIQLFGRRFFSDQTISELLVELLLVVASPKRIGDVQIENIFPDIELLKNWPTATNLEYAVKARLNLKLFSFIGASKLETRHETHRNHYYSLLNLLKHPDKVTLSGRMETQDVMRTLENLFLGFQGMGADRTWCAQTFLPISKSFLAGERIWQETKARKEGIPDWDKALKYFSDNQHIFLARGGEVLYLQLCNALRQNSEVINGWDEQVGFSLSPIERDPVLLRQALQESLDENVLNACPETIGKLAEFIDEGLDSNTAQLTDLDEVNNPRYAECGWCPEDSWKESYLFAVELYRISSAEIDPIERIELLEIACAMHVLRSLCYQSARYWNGQDVTGENGHPEYFWVISDPKGNHTVLKQISIRSVNRVQKMIYEAVRHPDIQAGIDLEDRDRVYREADRRYGHKLFLTLGKRLGLIVPKRGRGARFVLDDRLLRFLIMAVIRPNERIRYEKFKLLIAKHYGIVVDDENVGIACTWCGTQRLNTVGGDSDNWLLNMLNASGVLIQLSDSCSLVTNPFQGRE